MPRTGPGGARGGADLPTSQPQKKKKRGKVPPAQDVGSGDDDDLGCLVPLDSVVKVWCVHSTPNFSLPWQRRRQSRSSGSGFCIDIARRLILTNAHCIEFHAQVKVQRRGSDVKHLAKVFAVGWECDIAMLTVGADDFWEGMTAVTLNPKVPHLEEHVLCVGFPVGGDTISVTSGVISRIEVTMYTQALVELLGIQIDAAINSGNSGGPAFNDAGECVGIAFQSVGAGEAENIGYVIPTVVVMHFLKDLLEHGRYTGFPVLGADIQRMENSHLRESFGMGAKLKGVLVRRVAPTSAAAEVLKENDVLLSFDGEQIGNDGTVRFRSHERVAFSWLVAQKFYGEQAQLSVLRNGEVLNLSIKDFYPEHLLVPIHLFNTVHQGPSYLIVAGLVFTAVTVPFLRSEFGGEWDCEAPVEIVRCVTERRAKRKGEQLIVLTQVLAQDLTIGYEDLENMLLHTVCGTKIHNLRHVMELIDSCTDEYLWLGLHSNLTLVLKTEAAKEATAAALEQHSIPAAMSPDLSTPDGSVMVTVPLVEVDASFPETATGRLSDDA